MSAAFLERGWVKFPAHEDVVKWVGAVRPTAQAIAADPQQQKAWLRHGGTWFAGVNILQNDRHGRVMGGLKLTGPVMDWLCQTFGELPLDAAQISVTYPGYPKQDVGETDNAHRFRKNRDAAHVDGLIPVGAERRRYALEPHAYVLGLPLVESSLGASPMVVWEGSHLIVAKAFQTAFEAVPVDARKSIDLTDLYAQTRRTCFETCKRVVVHAQPGEAYVVHRLALHGVAPWEQGATADAMGRAIAYFRPELPTGLADWAQV